MLRVRLALVIGTSFGFVLFLGWVLYWGTHHVERYFHRTEAAYEAFDRYEQLSEEAYRHFKQRMDLLLVDSAATGADVEASKTKLFAAMERIRESISAEPGTTLSEEDSRDQNMEPERVARLTAFLEAGMYRFDEVERLRLKGERNTALLRLSQFLEEEIDRKFEPLIDSAIEGERRQALTARSKMAALIAKMGWVAMLAAGAAALFSLTAGFFMFRGIKKPIEALLQGTDEIAAGNLGYRIPIHSRNEFGYLARHFNQMATELEVKQEQLQEAQNVLEHRVAERTLELNKLNRELQRLDHSRREFFADISHELRTPITVIRGEAEVTLRGGDREPDEYRDALHRVLELSMQLGKLVNDMLTLARAETANLPFEWETVDLTELVADAGEDLAVLAREKSIRVDWQIPAEPVWIRGDRQRLRQVLFILGDNACRYSEPDTLIHMSLSFSEDTAQLFFQDQGIGIPQDDLESIFERYFRSRNARVDGSGLGLPMAKSIITAHQGEITAASIESQGTTFTVILPLLAEETLDEADIKETAVAEQSA